MKLDKDQVLNFLPHRPPFLFIDSVESLTCECDKKPEQSKDLIGGKVVANFSVREDLEVLRGHFPGNPILPGVVQVEAMAQASAFLLWFLFEKPEDVDIDLALTAVQESKFRMPVKPGMDLQIHAELIKARGPMMVYDCRIESDGKAVSSAKVMATFSQK